MMGYVILIAIAVALATAVFFFLKLYLPSERPTCYEDIDLVIDNVTCNIQSGGTMSNVHIEFSNRGLFNISAAYIKIGDAGRVFRTLLNDPAIDTLISFDCNNPSPTLGPGSRFCKAYTYNSAPTTMQEVSVEPLIWIDNQPVLCPESIVTKRIYCT